MFRQSYSRTYEAGKHNGTGSYLVNPNDIVQDDLAVVCMGEDGNFHFQSENEGKAGVVFSVSVSERKLLNSNRPYERRVDVSSCLGTALPEEISHIFDSREFTRGFKI